MNARIIGALVLKDLVLYFKNQFFAFVTILGLVFYIVIYFVMPSTVDETLDLAFYAPAMPPLLADELAAEGADIATVPSEDALKQAVFDGDFPVGIVLPEELMPTLAAGQRGEIRVYFSADFPPELEDAYTILMEEIGYALSGRELNLNVTEEILGVDRAGEQVPERDRMRPLFAVFLLMVETLGLASLISSEIVGGTIQALLVTPTSVMGLFVSKGIMGVGIAFLQAVIIMAATGGLAENAGIILLALLLGSMLVTGIAFLVASVAHDLMSVMGYGIILMLALTVPALGVLIPGAISDWVRVIPSFYLVDTVHQVANLGAGWADVSSNIVILLAFTLGIGGLGVVTLQRRFQ